MTTLAPLYEIAQELAGVTDALIETDGELTPELEAELDKLQGALEAKTENICKVVRVLDGAAKAALNEADRLAALARARANSAAALKTYLLRWLQASGTQKVETDLFKVWVQRNSQPSVTVTVEPETLPEPYRRIRYDADKKALAEAQERGEVIPAGVTVERGFHLRIR